MNKILTLIVLVLVLALLVAYRGKLVSLFRGITAPNKPAGGGSPSSPAIASLDRDKRLYKGVTGPEVKYLQRLLGVTQDGVFGAVTEGVLRDEKGVIETSINDFELQTVETLQPGDFDQFTNGDWSDGQYNFGNVLDYVTTL